MIAGRNVFHVSGGRLKWLRRNYVVVWWLISSINSSEGSHINQKQTRKQRLH